MNMTSSGAMREMPKYECHKIVHALKIAALDPIPQTERTRITPEDEGYASFEVDPAWIAKHEPQEGGYYVVYEDGYASYSPAKAFESGYKRMQ